MACSVLDASVVLTSTGVCWREHHSGESSIEVDVESEVP